MGDVCPKCGSDEIHQVGGDKELDVFMCERCNQPFTQPRQ